MNGNRSSFTQLLKYGFEVLLRFELLLSEADTLFLLFGSGLLWLQLVALFSLHVIVVNKLLLVVLGK